MLYVNPLEVSGVARSESSVRAAPNEAKALEEFEHYFIYTLMKEMRKTVPQNALFGGGSKERMFEEFLDDALAGEMARSGQFGIAKQIAAQLRIGEQRFGAGGAVEGTGAAQRSPSLLMGGGRTSPAPPSAGHPLRRGTG